MQNQNTGLFAKSKKKMCYFIVRESAESAEGDKLSKSRAKFTISIYDPTIKADLQGSVYNSPNNLIQSQQLTHNRINVATVDQLLTLISTQYNSKKNFTPAVGVRPYSGCFGQGAENIGYIFLNCDTSTDQQGGIPQYDDQVNIKYVT